MKDHPGTFLAFALALSLVCYAQTLPAATCADRKPADTAPCNGYYTKAQLDEWMSWLSKPRYTGDGAHIDFLERLDAAIGGISSNPKIEVERQERRFTRWDPAEPEIVGGGLSPSEKQVWPLPYSGLTGPAGVTAPLYYEGSVGFPWHFDSDKHAGKIVVLKIKPTPLLAAVLAWETKLAIPFHREVFVGSYRRAISLDAQVPSLRDAQLKGVAGLIVVVDEVPEIARDQYVPFTRRRHDVPAVYVDRVLGKEVIALAKKQRTITLRQDGALAPDTLIRNYLVTLRATENCKVDDQKIMINTHTDGLNWFEDNGPFALWSLLNVFAEDDCRPRDLVFVFAAAHFAHEPGSTDDIVRSHPELSAKARAALCIEHLGALRYEGKKDKTEPTLVLTTAHDRGLNRLTIQVMDEHAKADKSLRPLYFFWPMDFKYGEGKFLEAAEIPTTGFLTNPSYLLQPFPSNNGCFSPPLMCAQIGMLRDLIRRMMSLGPPER